MERENRTLKDRLASGQGVDLAAGAVDVHGVKVVATKVDGADAGALRAAVDQLKDRLKSAVVVLAQRNPVAFAKQSPFPDEHLMSTDVVAEHAVASEKPR